MKSYGIAFTQIEQIKKMDIEKIEQYPTKDEVLKSIMRLKKMKFPKYKEGDEVQEFVDNVSSILLN